jgi:predicted ATPase
MLKKLTLENWKSFRHAVLPIDPLTILIGTNASGKSNALEALEFLKRTASGRDIRSAFAGDLVTLPPIRGGIELAALKPATQFTLKVLVQGEDDTTDYQYSITVETQPEAQLLAESLIQIKQPRNPNESSQEEMIFQTREHQLLPENTVAINWEETNLQGELNFRRSQSILGQLIYQVFSGKITGDSLVARKLIEKSTIVQQALLSIFVLDPIPYKMRSFTRLFQPWQLQNDASNIAGILAALPEEEKAKIESIILQYMKDLPEKDIQKIWAEPVGRLNTDAMLYCEELWAKNQPPMLIDARGMSDGTLRFLAILTALLVLPEGSQLVIEDVDNGLHPSRSELLVKMLREIGEQRQIDILATTHNPALLDALGAEIVPFVVVAHRDSETGESELTLLENVENFSKLFASASLGKLTVNGAIERNLSRTN